MQSRCRDRGLEDSVLALPDFAPTTGRRGGCAVAAGEFGTGGADLLLWAGNSPTWCSDLSRFVQIRLDGFRQFVSVFLREAGDVECLFRSRRCSCHFPAAGDSDRHRQLYADRCAVIIELPASIAVASGDCRRRDLLRPGDSGDRHETSPLRPLSAPSSTNASR